MIENKNLNTHFLEACKKDNLDRLKNIISQAKENGISLEIGEGFIKASRYGKIKNLELLANYSEVNQDIWQKSISSSIDSNHLSVFKYLHKNPDIQSDELFLSVYMSERKDFLTYLLIDTQYQVPEKLEKQIRDNNHPQLHEIKYFYIKVVSLIKLNDSLEQDLNHKEITIKNKI